MPLSTGGNLLFAQYTAEMRAASAALFLVHRLMLCVYWHEGSTVREDIVYRMSKLSQVCRSHFLCSREPSAWQYERHRQCNETFVNPPVILIILGCISFQHHGTKLCWSRVRVRRLDARSQHQGFVNG